MIPPRSVLAAVDFSDSSRVALSFAARLATHSGAALHVMHVEDPMLAAAAGTQGIDLARDTSDELGIFTRSAMPPAAGPPALHVTAGPAAASICEMAARQGADVVVVGMRGISAVEHLVFGSTTEAVLRSAAVPVVAVPTAWTPPRPASSTLEGVGPVVVAIEHTDAALSAARAAARLARLLGTTAEAIHVVPALRVLNRWQAQADGVVREREDAARDALEAALRSLEIRPPLELRIESGHVAQRVADAVASGDGRRPVLVMGRRPRAAGTTAYRILTLANAPVLQFVGDDAGREGDASPDERRRS
jgi:nucleotide-binding universal stress UspA family protein